MSYYRLIEETDTEIRVSTKGIEVPGTECVIILDILDANFDKTHAIIFEDGRTIKARITMVYSNSLHFFTKCPTTDSSKKPKQKST